MIRTCLVKHINTILSILFAGFLSTATFAQTDNVVVLGGDLSKNQLKIDINKSGTYCVYRSNGSGYDNQFYATNAHLFSIKIGNTTFSSGGTTMPKEAQLISGVTLTAFNRIEDVGTAVTSGVQQEMTKRFTGTYSGRTFTVTLRILYNISSPDYFVKQATLDLRNIPDGTPVTYAYGWDTYVNGGNFGYAYLVPNLLNLNNNPNRIFLHLTTEQVQSLRMVGAGNSKGDGSLIALFPIGRSFDRAYSANPHNPGYCFNMPALTPGDGSPTNMASNSQYKMEFGPYNDSRSDNGVGAGYDHIPAGEITTIKTGFAFTDGLDGEFDYFWNDVKEHTAQVGDDVFLQLNYLSYSDAVLNNVGFHVDFTGLQILNACTLTGFTGGTSTDAIGDEYYELRGASVAALGSASVIIPVHITRAGQWTVDASSISNATQALPMGAPAKLTVSTTVSLANAENINVIQGSSKDITVRFFDGDTAADDVTISLSYSGATSSFSSLPASVTIPAGENSAKFTVTASPAGTNQAEVTVTLRGTNREYVTVATPSQMKLIILDPDKIEFTINDKNYKEWDGKAACGLTGSLKIKAYPDHIVEGLIQWTLVIDGTTRPNPPTEKEFDLPVNTGKIITVVLTVDGREYKASFLLGKASFVWTPENNDGSDKTSWNNPKNWTPAYIPSTCSDVYIPGNSSHYPTLKEGTVAECNDIYFIQGAELGRPDLLKYNRSLVQFNLGLIQSNQEKDANKNLVTNSTATTGDRMKYSAAVSTPLKRERWYMFTSPLQGVVVGDFGFGGFPLAFLRKFKPAVDTNTGFNTGQWTVSYTSMTETLSATEGFAFFMYGIKDDIMGSMESGSFNDLNNLTYMPYRVNKNYGIKEANGILELPFFADSTNLYAHRTQLYNSNNHQSTFYKIDDGTGYGGVFNNIFEAPPVTMNRESGNGNYRFITEEANGSFKPVIDHSGKDIGCDQDFMVGNPYMSSIDMVAFINDNENTIQQQFKIWNGEGFVTYKVDKNNVITVDPDGSGAPRYIAPLQSFFLKTRDNYDYSKNNSVAKFNVSNISATRPEGASFALRSSKVEENMLRIKAENKTSKSYMLAVYKENASAGFRENEDTKKLFSPFDYVPEIYALADGIPVDINFINDNGEIKVPLGIKTGQTGKITLTFTGMNNYSKASKIKFIDAKENQTVDLTGKTSYTYTYDHTEKGVLNGRFSLRISHSTTNIPSMDDFDDDLTVYGDSQGIYVITSLSDPVKQVIVYDLQGKKVYESASGAGYYPLLGNTGGLPVIVKVMTENKMKTVKIRN